MIQFGHPTIVGERIAAIRKLGREVLFKGMSSEKHFSPPEQQDYFFDIQPPTPVATFLVQLLDRFAPLSRRLADFADEWSDPEITTQYAVEE
jgi:hypothetical protein